MSIHLIYPTVEGVIRIHEEVMDAHPGSPGLRDIALLESAVGAPQATMMGERLFSDPYEIAAAYLFYLCSNHAFVDGNKRVALATCLVFLRENDLLPNEELDMDAWYQLTMDVASSTIDRQVATEILRSLLIDPA